MGNFGTSGSILQSLAPEIMMCVGAMVLLLVSVWTPQENVAGSAEGAERTGAVARFATVLCLVVAITIVIAWGDSAGGTLDQRVAADGFRWAIDLIILVGTGVSLLFLEADHARSGAYSPEVPVLMVLAATGMMILAGARDLMLVFLGIELMSLSVYVLAGSNRRSARSAESSIKYLLLGAFSTGFLLYGMALVFGASGSTRFVDIGAWTTIHAGTSPMFLVGLALLLVGFGFKVALVPFHFWTPDVYDGAPLPITAFMSTAVKTAGFAAFARLMTEALAGAVVQWHTVLWWLAATTMIVGNVLALSQKNVVRVLAYSSIAHAGYVLVAIVVNSTAGMTALLFYLTAYTLATAGAFGVLITVASGRDTSPTVDDMAGLWHVRPWLSVAMAVFMLALLGIPLAGGMGFFAKWYLLQSALLAVVPQTQLAVVLVLSSVISAGYYLMIVATMFMRERNPRFIVPAPHPLAGGAIAVTAFLLLVFGVYPTPIAKLVHHAVIEKSAATSKQLKTPSTAPFSRAGLTRP